jgi:hypothetical protein
MRMCADQTKAARAMLETGDRHLKVTRKTISFCVDSYPNYVKMMKPDIENDAVIGEKEKEKVVRNCNGHRVFWARRVNLCAGHSTFDAKGNQERSQRGHRLWATSQTCLSVQSGFQQHSLPLTSTDHQLCSRRGWQQCCVLIRRNRCNAEEDQQPMICH